MFRRRLVVAATLVFVLALGASVSAAPKTVTIRVKGMTCDKCSASVTKALKATVGVEEAQVSHQKGEAVITYDDQIVTVAKLREVINGTGFQAVEEEARP